MARGSSFNSVVAARTLAAAKILNTADLLAQVEAAGGLKTDLEAIVTHGRTAEALNQSQGAIGRDKSAATDRATAAFVQLQQEYAAIMVVLKSLRAELTNAGDTENLKKLNAIIKRETPTAFTSETLEDGSTKKTARRVQSQEGNRAEIARDAKSLVDFTAISARLAARRVDAARLQKLKADAEALEGKVADKVASASDRKDATAKEQAAVTKQRLHWSSLYPVLAAVARREVRVLDLLRVTKQ